MSVLSAARTLGRISGWTLTNLEIQKILYVAQMEHLERTKAPLFPEEFEAWQHGPVVSDLYHSLKQFKKEPVKDVFDDPPFPSESEEGASIQAAYDKTRHMTPGQLINFSHRPGGAWEAVYHNLRRHQVIPMDLIRREADHTARASDDAVAWAQSLAARFEASPARFLDNTDERSFRARLHG
jgi:uncharacterized phage-associated protein